MPVRVVFRSLADAHKRVWHRRDKTQSLFMPEHMHITHIMLIARPLEHVAVGCDSVHTHEFQIESLDTL